MGLIRKYRQWKASVEEEAATGFEQSVAEVVARSLTSEASDADIHHALTALFDGKDGFPAQDDETLNRLVHRVREQLSA